MRCNMLRHRDISIYLSYRNIEPSKSEAEYLYDKLTNSGFYVHRDNAGLRGGDSWAAQLYNSIRQSDVFIVLIQGGVDGDSDLSTSSSEWVQREIDVARGANVSILPLNIYLDERIDIPEVQRLMALYDNQFLRYTSPERAVELNQASPVDQAYKDAYEQSYKQYERLIIAIETLAERTREYQKDWIDFLTRKRSNWLPKFTNMNKENSFFKDISYEAKYQCDIFMVMPFRENLDPIYNNHIKNVARKLRMNIKRGDDPFSHHDIISEIWALINNCKVVIADCTTKNPNVFYEMGLANAISKPVIAITQNEEDVPFDIRHRRFIKYNNTPEGLRTLEQVLEYAISSTLEEIST